MRILKRALLAVLIIFVVLVITCAGVIYYYQAPLAVLVRNTAQLYGLKVLFPGVGPIVQQVVSTPGDPSKTGVILRPKNGGAYPGVLIVNGTEVQGGWRNSAVYTFAKSIAEIGEVVFVPDLPGLRYGDLSTETLSSLDQDVRWFHSYKYVKAGHVVLAGICVGGSLALLSAERVGSMDVSGVVALDPYASIKDLLAAVTTNIGPSYSGTPMSFHMIWWAKDVVLRSLVYLAVPSAYQYLFFEAIKHSPQLHPLDYFRTHTPPSFMPSTVKRFWYLLANTQYSKFATLYSELPSNVRMLFHVFSPVDNISSLHIPILIAAPMHDFAFPQGESPKLKKANSAVQLTMTDALDHVTPTITPQILAGYWQLLQFAKAGTNLIGTA